MTRLEVTRFIDEEVKGLYPQWEPTDAELRVWMSHLAPFDYGRARAAVQACFSEQGVNYHRPVLGRFLAHVRSLSRHAKGPEAPSDDRTTNVFVECFIPPPDRPHLAGAGKGVYVSPASRQSDTEYVQSCAEIMRVRFGQLYGGHWITVVTKPCAGDDVCGEPARQRAYDRILAGPDTPGRRFLQDHLSGRAVPQTGDAPGLRGPEREVPHGRPIFDSSNSTPTRIGELIPRPGDFAEPLRLTATPTFPAASCSATASSQERARIP